MEKGGEKRVVCVHWGFACVGGGAAIIVEMKERENKIQRKKLLKKVLLIRGTPKEKG